MGEAAIERLHGYARQNFGFYPTPLEELGRLRVSLGSGAPRLLIKRDDYTGFALGGNKVRKLEYELAPERVRDLDVLITSGGTQSNHARVTAAAAARLGLECILVLNGTATSPPRGNALLQRLFGAEIVLVGSRAERTERTAAIADQLARDGKRAMVVPIGASTPRGALGYALAGLELAKQITTSQRDTGKLWVFISASSAGTMAGLLLGLQLAGLGDATVVGVSPDDPGEQIHSAAHGLAADAAKLIGYDLTLNGESMVLDNFVGAGYGIPTAESAAAIDGFANTEGIVLDPVYTSKAAAALLDWSRRGRFSPHDTVIFWHTGGHPALFSAP